MNALKRHELKHHMSGIEYRFLDKIYCSKLQRTLQLEIHHRNIRLVLMDDAHEHFVVVGTGLKEVAEHLAQVEHKQLTKLFKNVDDAFDYVARSIERTLR